MRNATVFIMSMVVSTLVFTAGHLATATDTKLFSVGDVTIDGCGVSGELTRKDDGIYATFVVKNESDVDATAEFNYAAYCTPAMSKFARMMPRPSQVKADKCTVKLSVGESKTVEVLVRSEKAPAATAKSEKVDLGFVDIPASWTLAVSKSAIEKLGGLGGVLPAQALGKTKLKAGTAVLASGTVENSDKG